MDVRNQLVTGILSWYIELKNCRQEKIADVLYEWSPTPLHEVSKWSDWRQNYDWEFEKQNFLGKLIKKISSIGIMEFFGKKWLCSKEEDLKLLIVKPREVSFGLNGSFLIAEFPFQTLYSLLKYAKNFMIHEWEAGSAYFD